MKPKLSKLFIKRTLLTGGIVTPTGLLIDHWLNDKQPEQPEKLLEVQQPEVIIKEAGNDGFLETVVTEQSDEISKLTEKVYELESDKKQLTKDLNDVKDYLKLEKSISDTLSTAIDKAHEDKTSLRHQIKTLDESISELATELTTVLESNKGLAAKLKSLQRDYQTALSTVFELNKWHKELTDITNAQGDRLAALQSYLNWYEKNSVQISRETCIYQRYGNEEEDDREGKPFMECDASWIEDGKLNKGFITIEPQGDDKTDPTYKSLEDKYKASLIKE